MNHIFDVWVHGYRSFLIGIINRTQIIFFIHIEKVNITERLKFNLLNLFKWTYPFD